MPHTPNRSIRSIALAMMTAVAILAGAASASAQSAPAIDDASARVRLNESSRHAEYVDIAVPGRATPLRAFVVYPEIAARAPVVIVMHETSGLTDWLRGITDQLAADGFIAIAPDLLTGKAPNGGDTTKFASRDDAIKAAGTLTSDEVRAALTAVRAYSAKLPAATGKTATLAFAGTPRLDEQPAEQAPSILRQAIGQPDAQKAAALWPETLAFLRQYSQ